MAFLERKKGFSIFSKKEALYRLEVKMGKRRLKRTPAWDYLKCNSLELRTKV